MPPIASPSNKPFYWLWTYDAHNDKVIIDHNDDRHPADAVTHTDILRDVPKHDDIVNGYAYRVENAWRITDDLHKPIEDPHVLDLVKKELRLADDDEV